MISSVYVGQLLIRRDLETSDVFLIVKVLEVQRACVFACALNLANGELGRRQRFSIDRWTAL